MQKSDMPTMTETFHRAARQLADLQTIIDDETLALKQGRMSDAFRLAETKATAGAHYQSLLAELRRLGDIAALLPEDSVAELKRRHLLFERALELNLAIIATIRSVAEGLLRDVSQHVASPSPAAYGPTGRAASTQTAPVALSLNT